MESWTIENSYLLLAVILGTFSDPLLQQNFFLGIWSPGWQKTLVDSY